jgi:hypothetical protein
MRGARVVECLCICLLLAAPGCRGNQPPQLTEVEGVVVVNDEPLPQAQIEFVPELSNFGAQYNSRAVTDDQGKFKLVCRKGGEPGAVIGMHRVIVWEYTPPELRARSEESSLKLAEYQEALKNRPIPEVYGSVVKTPLRIEVTAGQKEYTIFLSRPKVDW